MSEGRHCGADKRDEEGDGREGSGRAGHHQGGDAAVEASRSVPSAAEGVPAARGDDGEPPLAAAAGPSRTLRVDSPSMALRAFPSPVCSLTTYLYPAL